MTTHGSTLSVTIRCEPAEEWLREDSPKVATRTRYDVRGMDPVEGMERLEAWGFTQDGVRLWTWRRKARGAGDDREEGQ